MISFFVPGVPVAQPRVKATAQGGFARVYTPTAANCWKATVAHAFGEHPAAEVLTGPVYLALSFVMPRPQGHYGTGRNAERLKDSAPLWHAKVPDLDNLEKAVKDALKGLAWRDDSQVCVVVKRKQYGDRCGCRVVISNVEDGAPEMADLFEGKLHT